MARALDVSHAGFGLLKSDVTMVFRSFRQEPVHHVQYNFSCGPLNAHCMRNGLCAGNAPDCPVLARYPAMCPVSTALCASKPVTLPSLHVLAGSCAFPPGIRASHPRTCTCRAGKSS
jgi:hypothetical protein